MRSSVGSERMVPMDLHILGQYMSNLMLCVVMGQLYSIIFAARTGVSYVGDGEVCCYSLDSGGACDGGEFFLGGEFESCVWGARRRI